VEVSAVVAVVVAVAVEIAVAEEVGAVATVTKTSGCL